MCFENLSPSIKGANNDDKFERDSFFRVVFEKVEAQPVFFVFSLSHAMHVHKKTNDFNSNLRWDINVMHLINDVLSDLKVCLFVHIYFN